jgi:type IV pilus assembly protein PilC
MLAIGFRTGEIDTVLAEVARRVAEDANQALDDLLNRIEPAIVIALSLLVGVILFSVMLPLLGIMTAIG